MFGEGNQITLESLRLLPAGIDEIEGWRKALNLRNGPVFFPRKRDKAHLTWYAAAFTDEEFQYLREDLMGFVGRTYTDFAGVKPILDPTDPIERSLITYFEGRLFRFEIMLPDKHMIEVRKALALMKTVWERRPERSDKGTMSRGGLIRSYELALQVSDIEAARKCLKHLKEWGALSSSNVLFLEIQLLAAEGNASRILELLEEGDVVNLPRPSRITQILIEVLYQSNLREFEVSNDPKKAAKHFRDEIIPKYQPLFLSRGVMRTSFVMKSFMMKAVTSKTIPHESIYAILSEYPHDAEDRAYLEAIANIVDRPSIDNVPAVEEVAQVEDYDRMFDRLVLLPPSEANGKEVLRIAYEIDTLVAAQRAMDYVKTLQDDLASRLKRGPHYRDLLKATTSIPFEQEKSAERKIPTNLIEWFGWLDDPRTTQLAREMLEKGILEWPLDVLKKSDQKIQEVVNLLNTNRNENTNDILRNSLPNLLEYLLKDGEVHRECGPIYRCLFFLLVLENNLATEEFAVIYELIRAQCESGLKPEEYEELLRIIMDDIWTRRKAPAYIDWILNVIDLLVMYPVGHAETLNQLISLVWADLGVWVERLDEAQRELVLSLCRECKQVELANRFPVSPAEAFVVGKGLSLSEKLRLVKIALYSLTERVGLSVKNCLKDKCPDVKFYMNSDFVGSDRLKQLATQCDIFLISTRSAKHAATQFIEANRPKHLTTLYPKGKGATSVLRALFEYLESSPVEA
jgi:hypothetical protein